MTTHIWKKGDRFKINPNFCIDNDADDEVTGVVEDMMACKDQEQEVDVVLVSRCVDLPEGVVWLLAVDGPYVWRSDWVTPSIGEAIR